MSTGEPPPYIDYTTLWIRGFNLNTDLREVRETFKGRYGECSIILVRKKAFGGPGQRISLGAAYRFESERIARRVLIDCNKTILHGSRVYISYYKDFRRRNGQGEQKDAYRYSGSGCNNARSQWHEKERFRSHSNESSDSDFRYMPRSCASVVDASKEKREVTEKGDDKGKPDNRSMRRQRECRSPSSDSRSSRSSSISSCSSSSCCSGCSSQSREKKEPGRKRRDKKEKGKKRKKERKNKDRLSKGEKKKQSPLSEIGDRSDDHGNGTSKQSEMADAVYDNGYTNMHAGSSHKGSVEDKTANGQYSAKGNYMCKQSEEEKSPHGLLNKFVSVYKEDEFRGVVKKKRKHLNNVTEDCNLDNLDCVGKSDCMGDLSHSPKKRANKEKGRKIPCETLSAVVVKEEKDVDEKTMPVVDANCKIFATEQSQQTYDAKKKSIKISIPDSSEKRQSKSNELKMSAAGQSMYFNNKNQSIHGEYDKFLDEITASSEDIESGPCMEIAAYTSQVSSGKGISEDNPATGMLASESGSSTKGDNIKRWLKIKEKRMELAKRYNETCMNFLGFVRQLVEKDNSIGNVISQSVQKNLEEFEKQHDEQLDKVLSKFGGVPDRPNSAKNI